MDKEKLFKAIGEVDDKIIAETAEYSTKLARGSRYGGVLLRFAAVACLALVIGASFWIVWHVEYPSEGAASEFGTSEFGASEPTDSEANEMNRESMMIVFDFLYNFESDSNTHVFTDFSLYDIGQNVPAVVMEFASIDGGLLSLWSIFQYVNEEFVPVPGVNLTRNARVQSHIGIVSPFVFKPRFYLCGDGRLILRYNTQRTHASNFFLINISEGRISRSPNSLPERPEHLETLRLYEMEDYIRDILEQFPTQKEARDEHYEQEWLRLQEFAQRIAEDHYPFSVPNLDWPAINFEWDEHPMSEEDSRQIVLEMARAFNDIVRIFHGLDMDTEREFMYEGVSYFAVRDERFPHFNSLSDIHYAINKTFTDEGAAFLFENLDSETPMFREIDGALVQLSQLPAEDNIRTMLHFVGENNFSFSPHLYNNFMVSINSPRTIPIDFSFTSDIRVIRYHSQRLDREIVIIHLFLQLTDDGWRIYDVREGLRAVFRQWDTNHE
ncbi:MAG: hypothetical protein FWF81_08815 [Defluviitaleaceae bacterium]|nr:hypothetical protein [Defluviitaleaceae bacterium]